MTKKCATISRPGDTTNIVLAGLIFDSNLGDQAIYESCFNIIRNIIGDREIEIRAIDLYGRTAPEKEHFFSTVFNYTIRIKNHFFGKTEKQAELELCHKVLRRAEEVINDNTAALIFVGGGLIKFNHQVISAPLKCLIEFAEERSIPVMLSAVGVEGYNQDDEACQELKRALNLPCIKAITTRDDLDTLRKYYVRESIYTGCVADPACSLSLYYEPSNKKEKYIGLSVCRAELFTDYEKSLKEDDLIKIWMDIYDIAKSEGYHCKIITNGLPADYDFAVKLAALINDEELMLMPRPKTVHDLVEQITSCEALIATRLHATIIAYSFEVPFVGFVWNDKQTMFGQKSGRKDAFLTEKFISPENAWATLKRQIKREPDGKKTVYIQTTGHEIGKFLDRYL